MAQFHHFSICDQHQLISKLVICGQNTKAIALLFGQTWLTFITFQYAININHFQNWSIWEKYQGYSLIFWPEMAHFHHFSICDQIQSISKLVIHGQTTKAIALLFGQKWLIFITFQYAININQFQNWSLLGKLQGYSLTFWPKMAHFITFQYAININQFQIWSFVGKIPRL